MTAYYNEIDPYAAQWLRNLIAAGHIAPGDVDERSIVDVKADDLIGYTQCHFFAGIGGWSLALRLAGWPDNESVWTGSCPCQPFSAAGKGGGFSDERHLWPVWFRLISECRPGVVFGEQVASKAGLGWLDAVYADLEGAGYACGANDLCAAGVGAFHIRQRLYFVGENAAGIGRRGRSDGDTPRHDGEIQIAGLRGAGELADTISGPNIEGISQSVKRAVSPGNAKRGTVADVIGAGLEGGQRAGERTDPQRSATQRGGAAGELADAEEHGQQRRHLRRDREQTVRTAQDGAWSNFEWLNCRDGKARPTQPGLFPLAHGVPGRVGRLRAYGNAIVPQVAAEFITAYCEVTR